MFYPEIPLVNGKGTIFFGKNLQFSLNNVKVLNILPKIAIFAHIFYTHTSV